MVAFLLTVIKGITLTFFEFYNQNVMLKSTDEHRQMSIIVGRNAIQRIIQWLIYGKQEGSATPKFPAVTDMLV